ncbi:MAG: class I adenylate-forming enzyme family protein [Candidatus Azotimanducaceae bacterium]|nr:AMP-dependent synthetase [Gammaproteobacteria bacterium]
MNIALFLQMAAEACPNRSALTHNGNHYSYAHLYVAAKNAANKFSRARCRYISLIGESSPAVPIALMGAAMAGVPYVPINYRLSEEQIVPLLERIDPAYLITEKTQVPYSNDNWVIQNPNDFITDVMKGNDPEISWHEDPSAIAVQLFTSGTTGDPKAAILRHEHLVSYILGSVEFMGALEEEASLVSVPPYHIAGISAILSSIYACRHVVQLPSFDPIEWLNLCSQERVTSAFLVPTMLTRIMEILDKQENEAANLTSLESIAYGGGKMPLPIIEQALRRFPNVNFTNAYGLTETSSTITLLDPQDHRKAIASNDDKIRARLGSVGKTLPSIELEIRDEEGKQLEAGEAGEIYVRGPQVSGEYDSHSVLENDGWFPTRDSGYLDQYGFLYLSGRADDVIVRGGENMSPGEIEDVLHLHPAIQDVAAVGIPSEEWGQVVALAVVLLEDAEITKEEICSYVREHLRSSRVPELIHFTRELPYNDTGKLLRRIISEWFNPKSG